jgi:RNA polymerase sigma factor (sigma-70 family)
MPATNPKHPRNRGFAATSVLLVGRVFIVETSKTMLRDSQLLQQYARENSQPAFAQLVERHSHWLYSVCLRRLGDPASAEDATQAVFLALALRARALAKQQTISPWLHRAARFCAANMLRARQRRMRYESEAALMKSAQLTSPRVSQWQDIEAELEPALDRLGAQDRAAILLRFYEQKTHPEIAATLGISLQVSQKRLSRALGRLRAILLRKGSGDANLSAIVLADLLAKHAVGTAPASLLTALSLSRSKAAARMMPTVKKILSSMKFATMKVAAIAAAMLLAMIPAGLLALHSWDATTVLAQTSAPQPPATASPSPTSPATSPVAADTVYKIPNVLFKGKFRANEYLIGVDPDTKRTPDSAPAGYVKSLLAKFNPNDQNPALRVYEAPYDDLHGKRVRLSAWLKTKNVEEWSGLEIVALGDDNKLLLNDDMPARPVHGTTDWTLQQIVVDIPAQTKSIGVASFLWGKGEVWSDDFQLQIVPPNVPLTDKNTWHQWSFFAANYTAAPDPAVQHDGHPTVCLASTASATPAQWSSFNHDETEMEKFRGNHVRVTIWIKSEKVSGGTGVWINGDANGKSFNEGQKGHRPLRGTKDWKQYSAIVDVPEGTSDFSWGIVMNGTGKIWIDTDSAQCVIEGNGTHGL